jgi:hypothetical protein
MDFVDATLLRVADDSSRAGVFDEEALEQLARAAYDADAMQLQGPFTADFSDFRLGLSLEPTGTLEGNWQPITGIDRTEVLLRLRGIGSSVVPRVDAVWHGTIFARFAEGGDPVEAVSTSLSGSNRIIASVTFAPPRPVAQAVRPLPITAALMIRDSVGFSIAELVSQSRMVRRHMTNLGYQPPSDPSLRVRESLPVIWVVPSVLFDDPDWPGATVGMNNEQERAARRRVAGTWLAREGIGLVVTS